MTKLQGKRKIEREKKENKDNKKKQTKKGHSEDEYMYKKKSRET